VVRWSLAQATSAVGPTQDTECGSVILFWRRQGPLSSSHDQTAYPAKEAGAVQWRPHLVRALVTQPKLSNDSKGIDDRPGCPVGQGYARFCLAKTLSEQEFNIPHTPHEGGVAAVSQLSCSWSRVYRRSNTSMSTVATALQSVAVHH
jgi:hypothetical protein